HRRPRGRGRRRNGCRHGGERGGLGALDWRRLPHTSRGVVGRFEYLQRVVSGRRTPAPSMAELRPCLSILGNETLPETGHSFFRVQPSKASVGRTSGYMVRSG